MKSRHVYSYDDHVWFPPKSRYGMCNPTQLHSLRTRNALLNFLRPDRFRLAVESTMVSTVKHHAALDAMVLGEQRVISYRTLSSELSISTTEAQQCLHDYIKVRSEKLLTTWAVTSERESVRRIALVKGSPPSVKDDVRSVSVWAVAPAKLSHAADVEPWIVADRMRELHIVKKSPAEANELRDNRWNRIQSSTAGWAVGGAAAQQRERMEALSKEKREAMKKKQSTGLMAKVKAQAAAREADRRKRFLASKNAAIQFPRPGSKSGGHSSNGQSSIRPKTAEGSRPTSSAFRTLGDALLKKRRPSSEPTNEKSAPSKKGRRIVEDSDDDEDNSSNSEGEDDEIEQQRLAMEEEALEAERAEEERKAVDEHVVEVEDADVAEDLDEKPSVKKSNNTDNDSSGSLENGKTVEVRKSPSKNGAWKGEKRKSTGKRDLEGIDAGRSEPPKKKYKPVITEVTEQTPDGYIRTVRVTKYLDQDGNERPAEEAVAESDGKQISSSQVGQNLNGKNDNGGFGNGSNGSHGAKRNGNGKESLKMGNESKKKAPAKARKKSSKISWEGYRKW